MRDLLLESEMDVRQLSQTLRLPEKDVYPHLAHVRRSTSRRRQRLRIRPACCRSCGYEFSDRRRLTTPSRCPRCKHERVDPPSFRID